MSLPPVPFIDHLHDDDSTYKGSDAAEDHDASFFLGLHDSQEVSSFDANRRTVEPGILLAASRGADDGGRGPDVCWMFLSHEIESRLLTTNPEQQVRVNIDYCLCRK